MTNQPIEEKCNWQEEFDEKFRPYDGMMNMKYSKRYGDGEERIITTVESLKSFIENLLEQERKDTFKRGYEAGIEDFGTRHRPTTPEKKCCGHKKWTLSKSTKRGTRKICNNCGKDWKNEWETPKLLPTSSYEVTCGRCEKSIKHSC